MVENKSSLFGIIAIIIGASGLGLGAFSVVNFQTVEGPQGFPGDDGQDGMDGEDAPGGLIVKIIDPDNEDMVFGNITIRAVIYGSENYVISVLLNGTEIGTSLPKIWDTGTVSDGWWNITVVIKDLTSNNESSDFVLVMVDQTPTSGQVIQVVNGVISSPYITLTSSGYTVCTVNIDCSLNSDLFCIATFTYKFEGSEGGPCDAVISLILDDTYTIGTMAVYDQFYSNDQTVHDGVIQGFYEDVSAGVHSIKFRVFKRAQDVYIGINWFSHTSLLTVMEIGA